MCTYELIKGGRSIGALDAPSPWAQPSAPSLLELHEASKRISAALLEGLSDTSVYAGSAESWAFLRASPMFLINYMNLSFWTWSSSCGLWHRPVSSCRIKKKCLLQSTGCSRRCALWCVQAVLLSSKLRDNLWKSSRRHGDGHLPVCSRRTEGGEGSPLPPLLNDGFTSVQTPGNAVKMMSQGLVLCASRRFQEPSQASCWRRKMLEDLQHLHL